MLTEKQIAYFLARIVAIGAFAVGHSHDDILTGLAIFGSLCSCVWLTPWLVCKLFLKRNQQEEVDGVITLMSVENNNVEYHLSIDKPMAIPYKDKLIIRVHENTRLLINDPKERD